jgi:hypothetical protein
MPISILLQLEMGWPMDPYYLWVIYMYMFDISSFKPNQTPHGFKPMFSHRPRAPNSAIMYVYIGSTLPVWHTLQPNQDWLLGVTQTILWLGGPLAKHTSGGKGTALKSLQGPSMVFHHAHIRGELGGSAAGCWAPVTSNQKDSTYCKRPLLWFGHVDKMNG